MTDEQQWRKFCNPKWLEGNWRGGWALDFHTVSSIKQPQGGFKTERTVVGEWLYQLKYQGDHKALEPLATVVANFLMTRRVFKYLTAIIPVPPSDTNRPFQPVEELAKCVGEKVNLPVVTDYLVKVKQTPPLKSLDDPTSRRECLQGAFRVRDQRFADEHVLLLDDIYRSGETLNEITRVLYEEGKVRAVYVLTITKTRVKQ